MQIPPITFVGKPSAWIKELLAGISPRPVEVELDSFLTAPMARGRVSVLLLEQGSKSQQVIEKVRGSGRGALVIWAGQAFNKDELLFAIKSRVYAILEGPQAKTNAHVETLQRAVQRAEALERSQSLTHSLKSALLQLPESGAQIAEIKTGLSKFEHTLLENEFVGSVGGPTGESRLPFYRGQTLADALLTIQDLERTGTLWVKSAQRGGPGRVDFLQGRPVCAMCGEARALKAVYRMFLWEEPEFTFSRRNPGETLVEVPFNIALREICVQGEALSARYDQIRDRLPPAQLVLELNPEALHTGTKLDPSQFSTLSSVVELGRVAYILDYNPLPDVVLYESLIQLRKSSVIRVTS